MYLKRILDDESGFTYTLEAIIGVFLIIGTVIFMTGNLPYTAQKTGEHSKVQLMNIGRDTIDLTLITPVYEIREGEPIAIYRLEADNYSVKPGDTVNFTVYYATTNQLVNNPLNFNGTISIITNTQNITANVSFQNDGTGHQSWIAPSGIDPSGNYEYSILAYDSNSPPGMSNFVTIKVGYYNLTSYTTSIIEDGYVSGVVTDSSGSGVPGLTIQILGYSGSSSTPTNQTPWGKPLVTNTGLNGNFSFLWSSGCTGSCSTGTYFIQAINTTTGKVSNMHVIEFSKTGETLCASYSDVFSCDNITVFEGSHVSLYMSDGSTFKQGNFYVNYIKDASTGGGSCSGCYITTDSNKKNATFGSPTLPLPGIYAVYIAPSGCSNIWAACVKTNIILITVLPVTASPIGDTCVNATQLNTYMRRYVPPYINYNLYLIAPNGSRFPRCPDFPTGQLINGYPTAEAVTVSKLAHIKYDGTIPPIDNITEYRMVLWYK